MINILNKNPLFDKEFLKELFSIKHREVYAKIILLTNKEEPLEQIEGKITDGSVSVDGTSAVRRTCSLTMVAQDVNINEFYWGLKNKFKLEIGLKNTINSIYPDIIWFKQGLFIITQFNTTQDTNKYTIKIQGKDKMCLLNGDLSGSLPPTDFKIERYTDVKTGKITETEIPIKTIIFKLLQEFALELPQNIIINDIDDVGYNLLEYHGESPFYLFKNTQTDEIDNMTPFEDLECYYQLKQELTKEEYDLIPDNYDYLKNIYIKDNYNIYHFSQINAEKNNAYIQNTIQGWFKGRVSDTFNIVYNDLLDDHEFEGGQMATVIRFAKNNTTLFEDLYTIIKIESGNIPGYSSTELVYVGELKSAAGESITSILDKIKNKFTNFEYYYDIDGKFIFQKKKEYVQIPWNSVETNNNYGLETDAGINYSGTSFDFIDGQLAISFSNNPKFQNLKNDYTVFGNRDNTIVRMRYAIDNKPTIYMPIRVLKEKIVTIMRNKYNGSIINEKIEYKYYDAPEVEPYNEEGLIHTDDSYKIIEYLDKVVNNSNTPTSIFNLDAFNLIKDALLVDKIGKENYEWALSLFSETSSNNTRAWQGTLDDIKKIINILNNKNTYYDNPIQMSIIDTQDGYEIWTIIYPYYAKYPYSVQNIVLLENNDIEYKNIVEEMDNVIHYKVDWRELIYQMALDYRKLNNTNNYYYYLNQQNNFISYNKTGYEQYYTDLISDWRQLYNPNSTIQYDDSISYSKIKEYSLFTDEIQENDIADIIYIKNGYSPITDEIDINTLNYQNVLKKSYPVNSDNYSIYPFYHSDTKKNLESSTDFFLEPGTNYYLKDDITNKINIINVSNGLEDEILKTVSPDRIYVKNTQEFLVRRPWFEELQNPEEKYKPYIYYIKEDADTYSLSMGPYNKNQIYYELSPQLYNNPDNFENPNTDFDVSEFPYISNQEITSDYIIYAEALFKEQMEKKVFINNHDYYIKCSGYEKLTNKNSLWDLYYRSNLYPLAFKTSDVLHDLENIVKNILIYLADSGTYIQNVNNIFKKWFLCLEEYNYNDINVYVHNLILELCQTYQSIIYSLYSKYLNNHQDVNEKTSLSCLYKIYKELEESYLKVINEKNNNNASILEQLFNLNNLIYNLNMISQKALSNIKLNYNNVSFILTYNEIKIDNDEEAITDEKKCNNIKEIYNNLNSWKATLNTVLNKYIDGQEEKTLEQVNILLSNTLLNKIKDLVEDGDLDSYFNDGNFIEGKFIEGFNNENYQIIEDSYNSIINIINELKNEINTINNDLIHCFLWIPSTVSVQNDDATNKNNLDNYLKNSINEIESHPLFVGCKNIKNIFKIFNKDDNNNYPTAADIISLLTFNDNLIFAELQEQLNALEDNNTNDIMEQFEMSTKDFQESIILEDVNNYNKINSNKIIYQPIYYSKAYYNYNRDIKEGNYWAKNIFETPELLTFWFDFLEPTSNEILKYSVPAIGIRSKVIHDQDVKSIHWKDIPQIIFKQENDLDSNMSGYSYIHLNSNFANLFSIATKGKTAKERIEELLYNYSHCAENINIQTVPIYGLEPNNKLYIKDDKTNINGEYLINKITIPLNFKKMMTITATKSVTDII